MKKSMKTVMILIGLSITFILNISVILFSVAGKEELAINEGESYTWKIEESDLEKLAEISGMYLYGPYEPGTNIKYTIEKIYEADDYWSIEVEILAWIHYTDKRPYETVFTIGKDEEYYTPGDCFVPKDAEAFLKDWEDYIDDFPSMENYSVDDLEVIYDTKVKGEDYEEIWEYQENGVLKSRVIEYDGSVVLRQVLTITFIPFGFYFLGFTAIAVVGIVIITIRKIRGGFKS